MINDSELKTQEDYSEGQKDAAHRILIELGNILGSYKDDTLVIGGWVPELLNPGRNHIGSVDVDLLLNHQKLHDAGYMTIEKILLRNGYRKHPEKYFSFIKTVKIENIDYDVDVDVLAGMYGGTSEKKRAQHVQGISALKATGGNFAFEFEANKVKIEAERPDGAIDVTIVNVVNIVPFIIMKTAALGRGKPKDAYDIYFVIKNYEGGYLSLAKEFSPYKGHKLVIDMLEKLNDKFASENHSGPKDVSDFLDEIDEEEIDRIKRDAYEQVQAFLKNI